MSHWSLRSDSCGLPWFLEVPAWLIDVCAQDRNWYTTVCWAMRDAMLAHKNFYCIIQEHALEIDHRFTTRHLVPWWKKSQSNMSIIGVVLILLRPSTSRSSILRTIRRSSTSAPPLRYPHVQGKTSGGGLLDRSMFISWQIWLFFSCCLYTWQQNWCHGKKKLCWSHGKYNFRVMANTL